MLAADKLQLQSALKQQATALKEKEFNLHHSNLMTVGTQAAVLAGLDITLFVEFNPPPNEEWPSDLIYLARALKLFYYATIVSAFCANMIVVSQTTVLSVLGAGLALRGPDGSMMVATDGLYEERSHVFFVFGVGLVCTLVSVVVCVWILLHWEAAIICMIISVYSVTSIYNNYKRVVRKFNFDESETVDFRDIMEGPANIFVSSWSKNSKGKNQPPKKAKKRTIRRGNSSELDSLPSFLSSDDDTTGQTEVEFINTPKTSNGKRTEVKRRGQINQLPTIQTI